MEKHELLANACANRAFVYRYLWRLFADVPDAELVGLMEDIATQEIEVFAGQDSSAAREQLALVSCILNTGVDALCDEYTCLFVGPAKLPAQPWESVYTCGEDLLFQQSTLDVRSAYHAAGFQAAGYPHIPDDHIATELNFMAALNEKAKTAVAQGDIRGASVELGRQMVFLAEHLGVWIGQFAQRLAGSLPKDCGMFYLHVANLAKCVCEVDAAALRELLEMCKQ